MPSEAEMLTSLERQPHRALVEADAAILDALHTEDFVLVNPGGVWSKDKMYIDGILPGEINFRRFDAVSDIEIMLDGNRAVLRYESAIYIHVRGEEAGTLTCSHTDCYRRTAANFPWQVVWSQATETSNA